MKKGFKVSLVLVVTILCWLSSATYGTPNESQCKVERNKLVTSCQNIVYGQPASSDCCAKIKATHFECICPYVTPKVAVHIDVRRVLKVSEGCGRQIPPNFKCGSLTIPAKGL